MFKRVIFYHLRQYGTFMQQFPRIAKSDEISLFFIQFIKYLQFLSQN